MHACTCVCVYIYTLWALCHSAWIEARGQLGRFGLSTMWIMGPGIALRLLGLMAGVFTLWAILLLLCDLSGPGTDEGGWVGGLVFGLWVMGSLPIVTWNLWSSSFHSQVLGSQSCPIWLRLCSAGERGWGFVRARQVLYQPSLLSHLRKRSLKRDFCPTKKSSSIS